MNFADVTLVLLHGPSGSGKSETAKGIAAPEGIILTKEYKDTIVKFDTMALSSPLIEMHSIKRNTQGHNAQDRRLWLLSQIVGEVIPPLNASFEDYIELIYDIESYNLNIKTNDGVEIRDRDFMTGIADMCHSMVKDPFCRHLTNRVRDERRRHLENHTEDKPFHYLVIVSDLRLRRELNYFQNQFQNTILIKLDVDENTQKQRLLNRDGFLLTQNQESHETQTSPFNDEEFDLVVNSRNLSLEDQISMTESYIMNQLPIGAEYANS